MDIMVDGIQTYYEEYGKGRPVLVLPGWQAKCSLYRCVADAISSGYRVILPDMPGFTGGTPEPPSSWDVDGFTDFTLHFIDALDIRELDLVGHSFGGRVIIKMMSRSDLPVHVGKIVLIDSAGIRPAITAKQKRRQTVFRFAKHFIPKNRLEEYKAKHGSADYRNASPLMRKCMVKAINEDLTSLIPNIKAETLLIWGTADTATPLSDGEKMERMIAGSGLVKLRNAGHFSFLDQPVIFNKVMKSFFEVEN